MVLTVDSLLQYPFSNRNREEKLRIVREGKPRPRITDLILSENKRKELTVAFSNATYDSIPWITSCAKRGALYCWPCLLFVVQKNRWNTCGVFEFSDLPGSIRDHERAIYHLQAMLDLQMYLQVNNITVQKEPSTDRDTIKKNREIAKRIVDVVCLQITQQRPPRKGTNDKNQLQVVNCLEDLQLLRDYDLLYVNHIDEATEMLQEHPSMVNDMVEVLTDVAKLAIKKEVEPSTFASVILTLHAMYDRKTLISTVLRFISDGKVLERFVGFSTMNGSKPAEAVTKHLEKVVTEYGIKEQLIAVACDGFLLPTKTDLSDFGDRLRDNHPCAFLVPCYFHNVDEILRQSLCSIAECDFFFKNLNTIRAFFEKGSKKRQSFDIFKLSSYETFDSTECFEFLRSIKIFRRQFIEFFDNVITKFENWTADDFMKASSLRTFLKDIKTIFMFEVFLKVFDYLTPLGNVLKSDKPEVLFEGAIVSSLQSSLRKENETGFTFIYNRTLEENRDPTQIVKVEIPDDSKNMCKDIFKKIMDHVISIVDARFEPLTKLEFFHILNFEKHGKFVMTYDHVLKLAEIPKSFFKEAQMSTEVKMLNKNGDIFNGKSVYQLYDFFLEANLQGSFENLFKLAEFILTMPCKSPYETVKSSKCEDLMTWACNQSKNVSGDTSIFCVERDILEKFRYNLTFYQDIIRDFYQRNKVMQLM